MTRQTQELARLLALRAIRQADSALLGAYHSRFAGAGLEFSELADYDGGDARAIRWPLSMRKGRLLVSRFQEEREMPMLFGVDTSSSVLMMQDARETVLETTALLAACAVHHNDPLGLLTATAQLEQRTPSGYGVRQMTAILNVLLELPCQQTKRTTNLAFLCRRLMETLQRRSRIILLSDFLNTGYEQPLKALAFKHDVFTCLIVHRLPTIPPGAELEDCETGDSIIADGSSTQTTLETARLLANAGVQPVILTPGCDIHATLLAALRKTRPF